MDPGSIQIGLSLAQGRIAAVDIVHHQAQTTRLLLGLESEKALALLPSLYSLCARAQGAAARAAHAAAAGRSVQAQDEGVAAEAAQEHLWRLLIDWPRELGLAPQEKRYAHWRRALLREPGALVRAEFRTFLETEFFGLPLDAWLAIEDVQKLPGEAMAGRLCQVLLQEEGERALASDLRETGAYPRRYSTGLLAGLPGRPLLARLLARMGELAAQVLDERSHLLPGTVSSLPLVPGRGRAQVETARGSLMHEVEIADGRVAAYTISSPTEVNFQPQGPLQALLLGRSCASVEAAETLARRSVLALDPCVACSVEVA